MFDSDLIKKLEYLSLVTHKTFAGQTVAGHRNAQLGGGIEFMDYRHYVPGDDLRHLDWNIYARIGSSLIKRFQEEGDLHVYCCIDISRSMGINSTSIKFNYAKNVAAALAYISLVRFDIVSLISFATHLGTQHPPVRGKQHFLSLMKYLEELEIIEGQTDINSFVDDILRRIGTPGLFLLISDFYDKKGLDRSLDRLIYRKFEPIVLQIYEPGESDPDLRGDFRFTDAESGDVRNITINESIRKRYKQCFHNFVNSIHTSCKKRGCSCYSISTDIPFDRFILDMTRDMATVRS